MSALCQKQTFCAAAILSWRSARAWISKRLRSSLQLNARGAPASN